MSSAHENSDTRGRPVQLRLDGIDPQAEFYAPTVRKDAHIEIKRVLAQDIKGCPLSRAQIAHGLSLALNREISLSVLDAMLSETKDHRFPAEWLPSWSRITGSRRALEFLCSEAGFWLGDGSDREMAELGRLHLQQKKSSVRVDVLKKRLWGKV